MDGDTLSPFIGYHNIRLYRLTSIIGCKYFNTMSGRGRGRGRGSTLPAWMTNQKNGADNNNEGGISDRHSSSSDHPPHHYRGPKQSQHGLGYNHNNTHSMRYHDTADSLWERDRGSNIHSQNFVREERSKDAVVGMGRGRGRGRGRGINNRPAWMSNTDNDGPLGQLPTDAVAASATSSKKNEVSDEAMELLLAQARQKREEQQQQRKQHTTTQTQSSSTTSSNQGKESSNKDATTSKKTQAEIHQEELQTQQKLNEEAARKLKEEAKRIEQLREEEEHRQLRALVGDLSDKDEEDEQHQQIIMMTDNGDDNHPTKRKDRNEQDSSSDVDELFQFQFETEEERDERVARKLREERRRKLRRLEQQTKEEEVEEEAAAAVDIPRNVAGVIQSEQSANQTNDIAPTKMEVDTNNTVGSDNHDKLQDDDDKSSDDESFDMFATTDNATPIPTQHSKNAMSTAIKNTTTAITSAQECDDAEGYYKANIGEIITLPKEIGGAADDNDDTVRFRVLGIIGKGVFSSVIKCVVEENNVNGTQKQQDIASSRVVAMKIIRNNEVMARAAAKEMRILRMLCSSSSSSSRTKSTTGKNNSKKEQQQRDNNNDDELDKEEQLRLELENHNIVRLLEVDGVTTSSSSSSSSALDSFGNTTGDSNKAFSAPPPEFRSHCIFLFEYLPHNLREVLNKFGKNVGINLTAVKSYARQLLCALRHLEKHRIVHSDIKPDNILVSANFSTLKICDFGSAFFETDHDNDPTPYLVSRFYRPPEVILGLEYDRMVDLWSVGVTISELYTGSVLFPGNSNNDMLKKFMDTMGPFSFKMVRRHNKSYERMGLQPHFEIGNTGGTYEFRKQDVDKVTGQPIVRIVNVLTANTEASLAQVLLKASKGGVSERVEVLKFASFLQRCLALDPARRLSVRDALQHEFFQKKKKEENNA